MLDHLDPNEPVTPKTRENPIERPLTDREVPLAGSTASATLHAWLDGELAESAAFHGLVARDVDFWLRLDKEFQLRRQMKTPAHVFERIMESLPRNTPVAEVSWQQKPITVTPMIAIAIGGAALVTGFVLGAILFR
jgi:hypothetical protein